MKVMVHLSVLLDTTNILDSGDQSIVLLVHVLWRPVILWISLFSFIILLFVYLSIHITYICVFNEFWFWLNAVLNKPLGMYEWQLPGKFYMKNICLWGENYIMPKYDMQTQVILFWFPINHHGYNFRSGCNIDIINPFYLITNKVCNIEVGTYLI